MRTRSSRLHAVVTPHSSEDATTGELGGKSGFGNTADGQFELILGAPATATADAVRGVYRPAVGKGHSVQPLVFETYGGFHSDVTRLIERVSRAHGNNRLGADSLSAPWCARSFKSIHTQRISVALHLAAAEEIMDTILLDGAVHAQNGGTVA